MEALRRACHTGKQIAAELGISPATVSRIFAEGVTVNIVAPGGIATKRIRQLDETRAEREGRPLDEIVRASKSTIPVQRYGDPQGYADVVAFLASERASYITGSMTRVDGGLLACI